MKKRWLFTLAFILLFSCSRHESFDVTIGELLEKSGLSYAEARKEIQTQLTAINRERLTLLGNEYEKVFAEEIEGKDATRVHRMKLGVMSSLSNGYYYDTSYNQFYDQQHERSKNRTVINSFTFDTSNYQFVTGPGEQIVIPESGPFSLPIYKYHLLLVNKDLPGVSIYDSDRRVLHLWGEDGNHFDCYNFNFDNKHFYYSSGMWSVVDLKENIIWGVPFEYFSFLFSAIYPVEYPTIYRYDVQDNKYKEIIVPYRPVSGYDAHASLFLKNPQGGFIYIFAASPEILFLSDNMDVIKSLDLRSVFDSNHMANSYKGYKYMIPWGDIYDISERFLILLLPVYHEEEYTLKKGSDLAHTMRLTIETPRKYLGREEDDHQRLAMLIDKKKKNVVKSGIFDAGFNFNHKNRTGEFFNCEMLILKDGDHILYRYSYLIPNKENGKWPLFGSDSYQDHYTYGMVVFKRINQEGSGPALSSK